MGKQILIVEDSAMMRKIITKTLTDAGHVIAGEAGSGAEALVMYQALKPDVVTMDITMRGMDGITAAREILAIDDTARIIILSNLNEDKYRDEAKKTGVLGLVNKHNPGDILALIASV
ncbi:MAG: response regulator [Candidatus Polarisedimenticolaceae bacterium]|nr:response regulator [Candidatus Polarisedimenticolaceae bacterium]